MNNKPVFDEAMGRWRDPVTKQFVGKDRTTAPPPRSELEAYHRSAWIGMHERCYNTKSPKFKRYGARGIRVCLRARAFRKKAA